MKAQPFRKSVLDPEFRSEDVAFKICGFAQPREFPNKLRPLTQLMFSLYRSIGRQKGTLKERRPKEKLKPMLKAVLKAMLEAMLRAMLKSTKDNA